MTDQKRSLTPALDALQAGVTSRRGFLFRAGGVAAAGLAIAACGGSDDDATATTTTAAAGGGGAASTTTVAESTTTVAESDAPNPDDVAIIAFAASLEVLAVSTYDAALTAATGGMLGEVPPAVAEYVTTAKAHHQAHLDGWNMVLVDADAAEVTDPPEALAAMVNDEFSKVTDVAGAATLALTLEQVAAATYLDAIGKLTGEGLLKQAASVQIIDMQHAAILLFALGQYPVPDTFASPEMAATPG